MDKKNRMLWCLGALVIAVVAVVWAACKGAGIDLPDWAIRVLGILDLAAVGVLGYASITKRRRR